MKLLLDENLSHHIAIHIADIYEISHVSDFNLGQANDDVIWEFARLNACIIVSKDADFHQRSLIFGHPPKLIYLKVGNCKTVDIIKILVDNYSVITQFDKSQYESILILNKL
jgi:predicted nuclease of predicted toxin-antitoxin system